MMQNGFIKKAKTYVGEKILSVLVHRYTFGTWFGIMPETKNMNTYFFKFCLLIWMVSQTVAAQSVNNGKQRAGKRAIEDTAEVKYLLDAENLTNNDSTPTVTFSDVNIVSFKTKEDWMMYYKYKSRIQKVLPYVKIARQVYLELKQEKEDEKKRVYRRYRKDVEKEMRAKFEKELKDLTVGQGEMLFKLINRETGNNAYNLIKEVKGSATAWFFQLVGKRWGYNLKDDYDPDKEKMIELIIKEMGAGYNVNS